MTPPTGSRSKLRASRLVGWALGVVVAAVLVGFFGVAGVILWAVNVSLPAHQRETAEMERELTRQASATAQQDLMRAAADGRLTDDEIQKAVGMHWDIQRADPVWIVRARIDASEPLCFSYRIAFTTGAQTTVDVTELRSCPDIAPRR